jgi:sulfite exporter TauE/SafE
VAAWGGANVLGGLALAWGTSRAQRSARWHFGAMSAGWGAVNVGIATAGLLAADAPAPTPGAVLAAERQFHDILLFNLGLNVAYAAVGGTMLGAGYRGVTNAGRWRGFGSALILQGAGLLALDGIAFFASRTRLSTLLTETAALSLHAAPNRVALTLQF